jgi:hypothetical protein
MVLANEGGAQQELKQVQVGSGRRSGAVVVVVSVSDVCL